MSTTVLSPRPTSERLRALEFRLSFLRASSDTLEALAKAGEDILNADASSPRPSLNRYTVRASIVIMICATIDGFLMNLGNEIKEVEMLPVGPNELRGSSLDNAAKFFKKVALLRFPDQTQTWSKLKTLFELRHALVHSWGYITDEPKRKRIAETLQGVVVSKNGEANLEATAVEEALRVMRDFADELEAYQRGPQGSADGT